MSTQAGLDATTCRSLRIGRSSARCALLLMAIGATLWFNHMPAGPYVVAAGLAVLIYMLFGWFGTVIRESEGGKYNRQVDVSFRWGMSWFIFSEVMFFAAFFGALFYMRVLSVPDLSSGDTMELLWPQLQRRLAGVGSGHRADPSRRWARGASPRSTR